MILSPFLMGTFIIVMIFWVMAALLDSNIANHAWQRLPWVKSSSAQHYRGACRSYLLWEPICDL
jgi:hypothetical protein